MGAGVSVYFPAPVHPVVDFPDKLVETSAMHELSLAESLIETIEEEARKQGFRRVRRVWLEAGALSGVDPEALRFGFEVATQHTLAEGAVLEILSPPGQAWCFACNQAVEIAELYDGCPHCQGHQLQVTGGRQFQLKELEVE